MARKSIPYKTLRRRIALMIDKTLRLFPRAVIGVVSIIALAFASGVQADTYKDRDAVAHPWSIDTSHALVWDGAPYIPFGVVFQPRYLSSGQTADNFAADEATIKSLVAAGVSDVLFKPGKGISEVPTEAMQKVIDLLDTNGVRYGMEISDPPYQPLTGYVVSPSAYRVDGVENQQSVTSPVADSNIAIYAICDSKTGDISEVNRTSVNNGSINVPIKLQSRSEHVLLFYPHKTIAPGSPSWGLSDIWSDFDTHRDRTILALTKLHFGKGLRFFIDPFSDNFAIRGETDTLIPTSPAFRSEFTAWLSRKYNSPRDLTISWNIIQHEIGSFDEAVHFIPLWKEGRGVSAVFDDGTGNYYQVGASRSAIWQDIRDFRTQSVRSYLDGLADVVKRQCADVPVLLTAYGLQPFCQARQMEGFDGFCAPASDGNAPLMDRVGDVYSLAESSVKNALIISNLKPAGQNFASKADLFASINMAHELCSKGYYVVPTGDQTSDANVASWLGEYAKNAIADKQFAGGHAAILYFPSGSSCAKIKRFSNGTWWLPTTRTGTDLYIGSLFSGYVVTNPDTGINSMYIWSNSGEQTIHLASTHPVTAVNIKGESTNLKSRKGRVELKVGEDPLMVTGVALEEFVPIETIAAAVNDLQKLVARAKQKGLTVAEYEDNLREARAMMGNNQVRVALDIVRTTTNELGTRMSGLDREPIPTGK
jgi:hypothetical protein